MKKLIYTLACAVMLSAAHAQLGLVRDASNNIVSRTNATLVWSNAFSWNNSTNAAVTISNLFTNSNGIPAFGAASNSVYTVVGGQGAWVESREQLSVKTSNESRSNWSSSGITQATNNDANVSVTMDANSLYKIEWSIAVINMTNATGWAYGLAASAPLTTAGLFSRSGAYNAAAGTPSAISINTNNLYWSDFTGAGTQGVGLEYSLGGFIFTRTGATNLTLRMRWWPTNSNSSAITVTTNTWLRVEKLSP
jgi:hypothetical protein